MFYEEIYIGFNSDIDFSSNVEMDVFETWLHLNVLEVNNAFCF